MWDSDFRSPTAENTLSHLDNRYRILDLPHEINLAPPFALSPSFPSCGYASQIGRTRPKPVDRNPPAIRCLASRFGQVCATTTN